MVLNGYDIAGVNGSGIITTALTGAFTIVKASEGQTYTDPLHDSFVSQLRNKAKLVGHYHYGRPDTKDTGDAVKEADHFIAAAKARTGETMWLDFEKSETADQRVDWPEWVIAFCDRVKARTGAACGVYWSDWFINRVLENCTAAQAAKIRTYPLWKAGNNNAYVADPSAGYGSIHGWPVLTCWQWNDNQGSIGIDRDIFYGDASAWKALGVGAPTQEDTMSAAEVQELKAYINDFFWEGYSIAGVVHEGVAKKVEALEKKLDVLATSGPTGTGPTAAEIADELAKRLET
jgi:GH25 family lysozyme M1 (1,4-beta-N-acetylmuramidase)